tara:strand:- start:4 stop:117 length:114 start_codon:yes stop_codon:yes gene_type:complete
MNLEYMQLLMEMHNEELEYTKRIAVALEKIAKLIELG